MSAALPDAAPAGLPGARPGVAWAAMRAVGLRAAWFAATLLGAVFFVQFLLWAAPGDPVDLVPNGEEIRPLLEAEWGLDRPLPVRFLASVGRALHGDLGSSLTVRPGAPVAELVARAAGASAHLLLPALLVTVLAGTALAWFTAGRGAWARRVVQAVSVAPVFLLAYLLIVGINETTFALIEAGRIARPGWFALPDQPSALRTALGILVLAVGSGSLGEVHAGIEDELVRIRDAPFVEAVIARGGRPGWHVLVNLLPPLAALAANRVAFLMGGLVVIEKVLMLNGGGALLWEACLRRDYPLATGLVLAMALVVAAARLLGDLARIAIDPRLRGGA